MAIEKAGVELTAIDSATRVFNQVSAAAKGLEKQYQSLKSVFESAVGAISLASVVREAVEWEKASNRLTAVLRATGNAAGLTRQQLQEMAHELSQSTPFNERDIGNAEANLLKFGNIHGQVFRDALKLSADYAAFTGGNVTEATQAIGRALADPVNGLKALQREFGNLTFSQKQYIAQLEAQGRTEEAQIAILDIVRNKIGGIAAGSNTGLTGLLGVAAKAWDQVGEAAALAYKKMQSGPSLMGSLAGSPGASPAAGPAAAPSWEEQFARQNAAIAAMNAKAAEGQDRIGEAHQKAIPVLTTWNKLLGDETNEQRALALILTGEAKLWNDLDKAKLLNIAVELDYRRIYKERSELAAAYAKALHDETQGEEENLATRVRVVENAFTKGTRETFRDYIDHAKNAAEQANFLFTNAFKNMEDGLVEFVRTGKLDFRSFADSVISDLIRIQIRQAMAGMLNTGTGLSIGASIGAFLGFGGSTAVDTSAFAGHTGGVVGQDIMQRSLPMSPVGIPRYHSGLAPDERLGIFQTGERIIPRGGSMSGLVQHIHVGGEVTRADVAAAARAGRDLAVAFIAEVRRREPNGPFGG